MCSLGGADGPDCRLSTHSVGAILYWQVPNLKRGHIEDCGHWAQMDRPAETNRILVSWLQEVHAKAGGGVAPKL